VEEEECYKYVTFKQKFQITVI
jgi:hypothetical protein